MKQHNEYLGRRLENSGISEILDNIESNYLTARDIENILSNLISDLEGLAPKNNIQRSAHYFLTGQDSLTKKQVIKLFGFLLFAAFSGVSIYVNPAWVFTIQHKGKYIDTGSETSNIIHCVLGTSIPALALLMVATWAFFLMRKSQNIPDELNDFLIPPLTEAERKRQDILTGLGSGISAIVLAAVTFAYGLPGLLFAVTILQAIVALVDNLILHFLPLLLALTKWYFQLPFIIPKAIFYTGPKLAYNACCGNDYEQIKEAPEDDETKIGKKVKEELIAYYKEIQTDILLEKCHFEGGSLSYKRSFSGDFKSAIKMNETAQSLKIALREVVSNRQNSPMLFDQKVRGIIEKILSIDTKQMDKAAILVLLETTFDAPDLFLALHKEFPRKFISQKEKTTLQNILSALDYTAGKLTGFFGSFLVTAGAAGYVALPVQIFLNWTKSNIATIAILLLPEYFFGVLLTYCGYQIFKGFYDLATNWGPNVPKLPLQFKQFPPQFVGLMVVGVYLGLWSYAAAEQLIHQFLGAAFWDGIRPWFIWAARAGIGVLAVSAMKDFYKLVLEIYALHFTSNEEKRFVEKLMVELIQLTQAMQNADPRKSAECKEFLVENGVIENFIIKNEESKKQSWGEWTRSKLLFSSAPSISTTPAKKDENNALLTSFSNNNPNNSMKFGSKSNKSWCFPFWCCDSDTSEQSLRIYTESSSLLDPATST